MCQFSYPVDVYTSRPSGLRGKNENDGRGTDGRMEQGIMAILKVPCRPSAQVS